MTVSFLDAKEGQCRFPPIWEEPGPTMLFCGAPTEDGSSFCPACRKVVYAPASRPLRHLSDPTMRVGSGERDSTPNLCEVFS